MAMESYSMQNQISENKTQYKKNLKQSLSFANKNIENKH